MGVTSIVKKNRNPRLEELRRHKNLKRMKGSYELDFIDMEAPMLEEAQLVVTTGSLRYSSFQTLSAKTPNQAAYASSSSFIRVTTSSAIYMKIFRILWNSSEWRVVSIFLYEAG